MIARSQNINTTITVPIVASVSQYWEGNDGPWSSFAIQVGNRPQDVRVLPSTASTSTWVVYDQGCPADAPSNCAESRGGIFNPDKSLTWVPNSIFEIGVKTNLDFEVFGDFGFDSVTLGWQGSGGPIVEHSIVAGIGDTHFSWLGVLGLNPRPTNFTSLPNSPQLSLIQTLKSQGSIPSVSWAYTAGAQYRLNGIFGSLVFGGFDTSRFEVPKGVSPDLTFPLYTDVERDLLVGISSIRSSNSTSSTSESKLLEDGIYALIDSTVPHLWLPESVCKAFEAAFGLSWNATTNLYILNSTQHAVLLRLNPSITITLSPDLPPSATDKAVSVTLPYSAFNLNLSWPHAENSVYYFPLRRAANETLYRLGRAFLQEAYLVADYERGNFSVWPCVWDSSTNKANVIPIRSVNDTSNDSGLGGTAGDSGKNGLGTGAIAGIAIGVAVAVFSIALATFFYTRKRRKNKKESIDLGVRTTSPTSAQTVTYHHHGKTGSLDELDSEAKHELESAGKHELESIGKHELAARMILEAPNDAEKKFEMDGQPNIIEMGVEPKIHEMDAQDHGPRIFVEPPTALEPGPGSILPSPVGMPKVGRKGR
ncbi:aspartic peptidase domain-containing protein [Massariosphaeria phaeospora]|uniref:Aspartic peptidase domain-containing protein n=1 Tax=Massariosphaeria phaeospora TaxID=100035 RepID=A0A7C8MD23_9PLEO|nr:aspartic peptidase domain-containing protein [Massariosphaeria phaeospora]